MQHVKRSTAGIKIEQVIEPYDKKAAIVPRVMAVENFQCSCGSMQLLSFRSVEFMFVVKLTFPILQPSTTMAVPTCPK